MVEVAKDFLGTQVEIIHSRIEDYEREEKFDYILSILVSHFIPYEEKESFFEHLSGLLNPQGKLILFDLFKTSEELHETWLRWCSTQGLGVNESEAMRKNVKEKFFPMSLQEFDEVLRSLELQREESFIQCLGFNGIIITK